MNLPYPTRTVKGRVAPQYVLDHAWVRTADSPAERKRRGGNTGQIRIVAAPRDVPDSEQIEIADLP